MEVSRGSSPSTIPKLRALTRKALVHGHSSNGIAFIAKGYLRGNYGQSSGCRNKVRRVRLDR